MLLSGAVLALALGAGTPPKAPKPAPAQSTEPVSWRAQVNELLTASQPAPKAGSSSSQDALLGRIQADLSDPFAFAVYGGRHPESMGQQTFVNGARMRIAFLLVDDPPDQVERSYLVKLRKEGEGAFRGELPNTGGIRYVSFRPTGSKNLKTLTLIPHGRGTIILASVGNPEELLKGHPDAPPGFPLPDGAERATSLREVEGGGRQTSFSFRVPGQSPDEVRDFYRARLPKDGFRLVAGSGTDRFVGARAQLSVTVRAAPSGGTLATVFWLQ